MKMNKLYANIDGGMYIGCSDSVEDLRSLAYQKSYILKYEIGCSLIPFYISDGYAIIDEFVY